MVVQPFVATYTWINFILLFVLLLHCITTEAKSRSQYPDAFKASLKTYLFISAFIDIVCYIFYYRLFLEIALFISCTVPWSDFPLTTLKLTAYIRPTHYSGHWPGDLMAAWTTIEFSGLWVPLQSSQKFASLATATQSITRPPILRPYADRSFMTLPSSDSAKKLWQSRH